jgi:hypothetical protein
MKTVLSKKGEISFRDIARGLIIAAGTSALLVVQQSIDSGELVFNWKAISMAAISGGVAYLIKNLLEPSKVITITNSASKAKVVKEKIDKSNEIN